METFLLALRAIARGEAGGAAIGLLLLEVSQVLLAGGRLGVHEDFTPVEEYEPDPGPDPDLDELRSAVTDDTRLILLNSPHNPTGTVLTRDELQVVADLAIRHDVVVVTDDVYEHLVFDDARSTEGHVPIATLPGMWERTLTVSSTGKTFSMTGWKVGYAIGPPALSRAVRAVHQYATFATATPFQEAMAEAMAVARERGYYESLRREYAARRDLLAKALNEAGSATNLHYPIPVHLQPAFAELGHGPGAFPLSERHGAEELSLPMFPEMTAAQVDEVAAALRAVTAKVAA